MEIAERNSVFMGRSLVARCLSVIYTFFSETKKLMVCSFRAGPLEKRSRET